MTDEPRTYRTKTGRVLTDPDIQALADEAERGYDVERLVKRPGRPRMGSAPAVVVPVRLHADLHAAVKAEAEAEGTSLSELVRDALRSYLATKPTTNAESWTSSGRVLSDIEVEALAAEAAAGYDVGALRDRPNRGGRGEVVPVRMPPELKEATERRAAIESTSVSEIVREAMRERLADDRTDPPGGGAGRRGTGAQHRRPTEADTCRDYVRPAPEGRGLERRPDRRAVPDHRRADHQRRERSIGAPTRSAPTTSSSTEPGLPVAVVEAKREYSIPGKGHAAGEELRAAARRAVCLLHQRQGHRRRRPDTGTRDGEPRRLPGTGRALGALPRIQGARRRLQSLTASRSPSTAACATSTAR